MANALLVEGSNSEYKQPGASPAGLGEPLARHHHPITFIVSLFADGLPLTAVRPSENCTLIGKSSGSLSYGRAERYRNIYLLLLAIPRGARQTLPDSLLQLIVFRPVVVTMPVTRTVLPRQFGSCRSAPAESVMEVFAVLKPGDDSQ